MQSLSEKSPDHDCVFLFPHFPNLWNAHPAVGIIRRRELTLYLHLLERKGLQDSKQEHNGEYTGCLCSTLVTLSSKCVWGWWCQHIAFNMYSPLYAYLGDCNPFISDLFAVWGEKWKKIKSGTGHCILTVITTMWLRDTAKVVNVPLGCKVIFFSTIIISNGCCMSQSVSEVLSGPAQEWHGTM